MGQGLLSRVGLFCFTSALITIVVLRVDHNGVAMLVDWAC
jgi:hypothetical protein